MIKTIDELLDKLQSEGEDISTLKMWREQLKSACKRLRNRDALTDEEFRDALDHRDAGHYKLLGSVKALQIVGVISWKEESEIQKNLLEEFLGKEDNNEKKKEEKQRP